LQRRRCFEETTLRVFIGGIIGVYDLAGLHLFADVRLMSVRDAGGRGRATHRRPFVRLDRVEEHLSFPQLPTRSDDVQASILDGLARRRFSAHHAASPLTEAEIE
jgi:hypothetical protein